MNCENQMRTSVELGLLFVGVENVLDALWRPVGLDFDGCVGCGGSGQHVGGVKARPLLKQDSPSRTAQAQAQTHSQDR